MADASLLGTVVDVAGNAMSGGILGVASRLLPEVIGVFRAKGDRDHEYRMAQLQTSDKAAERDMGIKVAGLQLETRDVEALIAGAAAQATPTGIKIIDALNASVRPVLMYWWMTLYTLFKVAAFSTILVAQQGAWAATVLRLWTGDDVTILFSLISYFTLDRTMRKGRPAA